MISSAPSGQCWEYGWKKIAPTLAARDYKDPKLVADFRNDEGLRIRKNGIAPCLPRRRHSETDVSTMPPLVINDIRVHCTQQRGSGRPSLTAKCDCGSGKLKKKCCGTGGGSGHLSTDEQIMYCLNTNSHTLAVEKNSNIRRLTPIECERLQGFPDNWTDEQFDSHRYKQCGNAVSVPVVKAIMEKLYGKM